MHSVWRKTTSPPDYPSLDGNITTDVLIIGGGMCGTLTAHRLKEAGVSSVVLEAETIGGGVTQNTTAKITAQHGLIYADLIKRFGIEKARQYYEANTWAIEEYRALAAKHPCDFEEKTAYVYSKFDCSHLEREAEAYQKLGIPANIEAVPELPLQTVGAVVMEHQAQFHPLKLLYALADGLTIYTNSFVHRVKDNVAYTKSGAITAKHIVLATHYPLINIPGLYFLKLYQHRSYVLALENAPLLDGMYLDAEETGLSFRTYAGLLFLGGGDHRSGKQGGNYVELEAFAKQAYPQTAIKYRWATQDCMPLDHIPYIGRHRRGTKSLYVATGFQKWGMTSSMVASKVLTDLLLHGKSDWEALYAPNRSILSKQLFKNLGAATAGLLSIGGPRCAHMGCKLHQNHAENTLDCACHGSRFTPDGHLITGPAKHGIRKP